MDLILILIWILITRKFLEVTGSDKRLPRKLLGKGYESSPGYKVTKWDFIGGPRKSQELLGSPRRS